jgi:hypothetical protein
MYNGFHLQKPSICDLYFTALPRDQPLVTGWHVQAAASADHGSLRSSDVMLAWSTWIQWDHSSVLDQEPVRSPGVLSRFLQPALLGALVGIFVWFVGVQGSDQLQKRGSSVTPAASAPSLLTRSCTSQEVAFSGAIRDCAVRVGPIGTCSVNGNPTPCGVASGQPIPCDAVGSTSSDVFGISLTLRGVTESIYQVSVGVTHGYQGDGTYLIRPLPTRATALPAKTAAVTVADSISQRFWTATSGTLTIKEAGKSGMFSAVLQPSSGPPSSASPGFARLDGPWACG